MDGWVDLSVCLCAGRIDMDALFTGTSNLARERTNKIEEATVETLVRLPLSHIHPHTHTHIYTHFMCVCQRNTPSGMKAEDLLREVNQALVRPWTRAKLRYICVWWGLLCIQSAAELETLDQSEFDSHLGGLVRNSTHTHTHTDTHREREREGEGERLGCRCHSRDCTQGVPPGGHGVTGGVGGRREGGRGGCMLMDGWTDGRMDGW